MHITDDVKSSVVLPTHAYGEEESQPASLSCWAEAAASLRSYDEIVCTEGMCFNKN